MVYFIMPGFGFRMVLYFGLHRKGTVQEGNFFPFFPVFFKVHILVRNCLAGKGDYFITEQGGLWLI